MCIAAAIGGAAVVGLAGTAIASSNASDAAKSAANTQANAAYNAQAIQQKEFNQTDSELAPYRNVGTNALYSLADLYGVGTGAGGTGAASTGNPGTISDALKTFEASPEYQFALGQGTQSLDRSQASKGLLLSGAQLKDAQAYGQGYASTNFSNYFNQLASLAGLGQAATTTTGQLGQSASTNEQNDVLTAGTARGSGYVGAANAVSGGVGQSAGLLSQLSGVLGSNTSGIPGVSGNGITGYNYTANDIPTGYSSPSTTYDTFGGQ